MEWVALGGTADSRTDEDQVDQGAVLEFPQDGDSGLFFAVVPSAAKVAIACRQSGSKPSGSCREYLVCSQDWQGVPHASSGQPMR